MELVRKRSADEVGAQARAIWWTAWSLIFAVGSLAVVIGGLAFVISPFLRP
jgi:CHASE3 domain sensor protein